jgi:hypothetical protein
MKVQITKMQKVEVPTEYQKEEGCVAFQLVKVVIDFYGKLIEDVIDTKILQEREDKGGYQYYPYYQLRENPMW